MQGHGSDCGMRIKPTAASRHKVGLQPRRQAVEWEVSSWMATGLQRVSEAPSAIANILNPKAKCRQALACKENVRHRRGISFVIITIPYENQPER